MAGTYLTLLSGRRVYLSMHQGRDAPTPRRPHPIAPQVLPAELAPAQPPPVRGDPVPIPPDILFVLPVGTPLSHVELDEIVRESIVVEVDVSGLSLDARRALIDTTQLLPLLERALPDIGRQFTINPADPIELLQWGIRLGEAADDAD